MQTDGTVYLLTIAYAHTCREISYMHLIEFHSGVKQNKLMTIPSLP